MLPRIVCVYSIHTVIRDLIYLLSTFESIVNRSPQLYTLTKRPCPRTNICAGVGLYPCRGNASYDLQWDTGSNKQAATRSILHSVSYAAASTMPTEPTKFTF